MGLQEKYTSYIRGTEQVEDLNKKIDYAEKQVIAHKTYAKNDSWVLADVVDSLINKQNEIKTLTDKRDSLVNSNKTLETEIYDIFSHIDNKPVMMQISGANILVSVVFDGDGNRMFSSTHHG